MGVEKPSIFRPSFAIGEAAVPGRMPPCNVEAEQALLGAILANNKALDRVGGLEPYHFADPIHARIFQEIRRLTGEGSIADPITLKTVFEHSNILEDVGGTKYLVQLLTAMVGIINAGDYAKAVRDTWLRRELIDVGEILVNAAFGDGSDMVNPVRCAMDAVAMIDSVVFGGQVTETGMSLDTAMDRAIEAMNHAQRTDGAVAGISTGFPTIDRRLGGLEPGLVYVLAGRPGMGKSALGHKICINVAKQKIGVHENALEMSGMQLGRRALSSLAEVSLMAMKTGSIGVAIAEKIRNARIELAGLPLTIDEAAAQSPRMIGAKARAAKRKHGLGLLMVDHLNLTRPDDDDGKFGPTHAIEQASGMFKKLAKELEVPVLLLVQLSRAVEAREDKRPTLADLRQSGAIEQDADAVGFLYREEYYLQNDPEQTDRESNDSFETRKVRHEDRRRKAKGKADLIWAKVRDGTPATDKLLFDGPTTTFSEDPAS